MKTVLITGVNKGLGHHLLQQFTAKGYKVFGVVRNEIAYKQMCTTCGANVTLINADVADDACVEAVAAAVGDAAIDLLINNAGIGGDGMALDGVTTAEIQSLFNIHCLGALRMVMSLRDNLLKSANPVVLNMNSRFGSITYQYNRFFKEFEISYAYRIAKAAQNMLTNCLRNELGDRIEFVSITPGRLMTSMAQTDANLSPEEGAGRIIEHWEAGRFRAENGILQVPDMITPW